MRLCRSSGLSVIDKISNQTGKIISVAFLIPFLGCMSYEVVSRYVFNAPTRWSTETVGFLSGAYCIMGGAYALYHNRHVRMDVIYSRLSSRKKAVVDLITFPFFFLFCGVLVWFGWDFAWQSVLVREATSSAWGPPLYPFKLILPIGAFLLLLQGAVNFARNLNNAMTGGKKRCEH